LEFELLNLQRVRHQPGLGGDEFSRCSSQFRCELLEIGGLLQEKPLHLLDVIGQLIGRGAHGADLSAS